MEERSSEYKTRSDKEKYRTCCSICNIKFGTVFLGTIEAVVCIIIFITVAQQIVWKNQRSELCNKNFLRDCLIFQFNHFNITLIFDYIILLLIFFTLLSVLLLFCGILSDTSCLLLPHIIVQALFLLFSLGYFLLYAFSYFYGDLYTHKRPFLIQSLVERMWLASLLLFLAGFQTYLFSAVIRCSMYISNIEDDRRRRENAFERCSERVRIAKENGLWRTTSWGGGFQQYKGQYDETKTTKKSGQQKGFRVQWNFQKNVVVEDETEQISESTKTNSLKKNDKQKETAVSIPLEIMKESKTSEEQKEREESPRRRSNQSQEGIVVSLPKLDRHHTHPHHKQRGHSDSPKKDRVHRYSALQKTSSEGSKHIPTNTTTVETHKQLEATRSNESQKESIKSIMESTEMRKPHRTNSKKEVEPIIEKRQSQKEKYKEVDAVGNKTQKETISADNLKELPATTHIKLKTGRAPLRTYKSVDSDNSHPEELIPIPKKEVRHTGHRRRSSLDSNGLPVSLSQPSKQYTKVIDKRHEFPVVKKISITATHV